MATSSLLTNPDRYLDSRILLGPVRCARVSLLRTCKVKSYPDSYRDMQLLKAETVGRQPEFLIV